MVVSIRKAPMMSLLMALASVLPAAVPTASAQTVTVMATGLNNPRGLAFGPDGVLYVVEAGTGGTSTLCLPNTAGPGTRCYGPTGAVTRVTGVGVQARVLTGLPSVALPSGEEATGPQDIAFGFGRAFLTIGAAADPALLDPFRAANIPLGQLIQVSLQGQITPLVDIAAYEGTANPDGGERDSNPFGLELLSNRAVMTDAGGNSLIQVDPTLTASTLATFPVRLVPGPGGMDVPMQSVPTGIAEGPDGSLYVGELTGFPFQVGGARVYRVPAAGGTPVVVAEGFTNIIDIAIGADGAAYVLEHDANGLLNPGDTGRLVKIGPFGSRTELAAGALVRPGKMAIGADNSIYVTTNSASVGTGQVVRITQ